MNCWERSANNAERETAFEASTVLDVSLDLVCMIPTGKEDFFDACVCKEFQSIFDQWCIGQREETLHSPNELLKRW